MLINSCSALNNPFSPSSAQWEQTAIDIQGIIVKAEHVDVTNVIMSWPDNIPSPDGYIYKLEMPAMPKMAPVVVAWSEKPDGCNWQICFRVIFWEDPDDDDVYEQNEGPIHVISDPEFNYTYPAVSAMLRFEYYWNPEDPPVNMLFVYLAYEKWEPGTFPRDVCYRSYWTDFGDLEGSIFTEADAENILNPTYLPPITCRHPDIVYYSYNGDGYNSGCDTVFVACDYVAMLPGGHFQSGIAAWEPLTGVIEITCHFSPTPPFPGYAGKFVKPEFPRIDAGLDCYIPFPPDDDPLSIMAVTWHEHKWILGDPQEDPVYEDYDWFYANYDLSSFPIPPTPLPVKIPPNNEIIWDMYPYIDIDPIETCDYEKSFVYSHFVWTRGQDVWPDNDAFQVRYTNSNMLMIGEWEDVAVYHQSFSGQASILMYAWQEYLYNDEPDFDVFFISNHEDGVYRYYSRKFLFEDDYDLVVNPYDNDPVRISPLGYSPPLGEILYDSINVPTPVGALFDYRSEIVTWKEWDMLNGLHHIYGNYEVYLKD